MRLHLFLRNLSLELIDKRVNSNILGLSLALVTVGLVEIS